MAVTGETAFSALVVREVAGEFTRELETRIINDLPAGEVLIRVAYSSLNYKDALSATGVKRVTPHFPHTPGIDAAGEVVSSEVNDFSPGDQVLVTGFALGMSVVGGYGQYIRVPAAWVVKRPPNLSARRAMALGTAGFTAGLSLFKLQQQVQPEDGEILVTGASGGVGSVAVALLRKAGYRVVAVTGKQSDFLQQLGVQEILTRQQLDDESGRAMLSERWAGVIDTVGGNLLASAVKGLRYGGVATCCGWVAGVDIPINMYPFMIRGVSLVGIDSVQCAMPLRQQVWHKLADEWQTEALDELVSEVPLAELSPLIDEILQARVAGRVVVDLQ